MPSDITELLADLCDRVQSAASRYGSVQRAEVSHHGDTMAVARELNEQFCRVQTELWVLLAALADAGFPVPDSWHAAIVENTPCLVSWDGSIETPTFDTAALDSMRKEIRAMLMSGALPKPKPKPDLPPAMSNGPHLSGEAKALALLAQHADWTDTAIAKAVGVSRTTLYDWPRFNAARQAMRQTGKLRRGVKDRHGRIETDSD